MEASRRITKLDKTLKNKVGQMSDRVHLQIRVQLDFGRATSTDDSN